MITTKEIGQFIKNSREKLGVTQKDLALSAGTATRFISDLENGKETCQIGKVLQVLHSLGIQVNLDENK
jgi:y4mF family transcriptional regulator